MNRRYVAPISFGLGDLVVSLPVIQACIADADPRHEEIWLIARSSAQAALAERIEGLAGSVGEDTFDSARCDGPIADLREHRLQRDHWWGSPEFDRIVGPLSINEILDRICTDFGIDANFARPDPLLARPRPEVSDIVLLVTETDGPSKRWPAERWASLAAQIHDAGGEARLVTRTGASPDLRDTAIKEIHAPSPGDAVDLLSSCRAVVGVDTGLTHIAVQQATPTVTITRDRPVFFRPWPHCRAVIGDRCDDACAAIERERAYNRSGSLQSLDWKPQVCPVVGRCLDPVSPQRVMAALEDLS